MNANKMVKQLGNGAWIDVGDDTSELFRMIASTPQWNVKTKQLESIAPDQIVARLEAGETLKYTQDWYANVRIVRPASTMRRPVIYVACDCGHECSERLVMTTSRGTSCPDCYDRMSDK